VTFRKLLYLKNFLFHEILFITFLSDIHDIANNF